MSEKKPDAERLSAVAPFGLRMLPELKQRIADAAQDSRRSMNAEIVSRLERTLAIDASNKALEERWNRGEPQEDVPPPDGEEDYGQPSPAGSSAEPPAIIIELSKALAEETDRAIAQAHERVFHRFGIPRGEDQLSDWKLYGKPATDAGTVQSLANIINRGLMPAQVRAGVTRAGAAKYTGMHALRHFYASWCINRPKDGGLGLPPKSVQDRLGHATIALTMDVYGHLLPRGDDAKEMAAAERSLLG